MSTNLQLTDEQQAIVAHIKDQPALSLMVEGVAGCAKTTTIEAAAQAISPQLTTLAVAFNKKIADELGTRLPDFVTCKTLNGIGHGAWGSAIGKRCSVDADKLFKQVKDDTGVKAAGEDTFSEVLALVRGAKSAGLVPHGAPMGVKHGLVDDHPDNWEDIAFTRGFALTDSSLSLARAHLKQSCIAAFSGLIDFDDQIYMSVLFGGRFPKYHTVIVDEAQDLSPLNHEQIVKLVGTRLIAVGDPHQAIYGFRGADSNSMANLRKRFEQEHRGTEASRLMLTYSFRCPKAVAFRQTSWVSHFKPWGSNKEGEVIRWTAVPGKEGDWSLSSIPSVGAVLCRNNAPLMRLAFALIKARRPVKILGRDIGASLGSLLNKVCGKKDLPVSAAQDLLYEWKIKELAKYPDSESKQDTIYDRFEALAVLLDASDATTTFPAIAFIKDLFADKAEGLVLSSGHRAKGLEWDWVMHLDPWRCPSKLALKAADHGNPAPLMQEKNLQYVIETRTKNVLVLANLQDCEEIGE